MSPSDYATASGFFDDLLKEQIVPELLRVRAPDLKVLESEIPTTGTEREPAAYEIEVFNFLLAQKEPLGVAQVERAKNFRVDGAITLAAGYKLAIEIKYRMDWQKACQAEAQFRWFLGHTTDDVAGGIVFFEQFAQDWVRRPSTRRLENGWTFWYSEHSEVEGRPLHLVRLRNGELQTLPLALAAAHTAATVA
jgi:hypothetical protein